MKITDTDFPVSEIFGSLQGEGNFAGVNSLFIRFQLCNLTCVWCDTKYTWTRFSDHFRVYEKDQLRNEIEKTERKHIIFTGGEPSLFRLDHLAEGFDRKFHVESNGTIIPVEPLNMQLRDGVTITREAMDERIIEKMNWVISPKLSNSKQEIIPGAIEFWANQPFAVFKFVTGSTAELDEAEDFISKFKIDKTRVYMGLLGTTPGSQMNAEMADEIIRRGFHFSPRLQVLFWGQKRGK